MTDLDQTLRAARKDLRVLFVKAAHQHDTMAALTLHFWRRDFVQDGPGIQGDWPAARTSLPNSKGLQVPVLCWEAGEMIALLFHDHSAIVAKKLGSRVTAIPAIFKIASEPKVHGRAVPVVRSQLSPQAMISFRHLKHETRLPSFDVDAKDLRSMPGAETALDDLEHDLRHLANVFSQLPDIHVPEGCPPHPAPDEIWLPWLPQCWVSQDARDAARQWCQDIADWISLHHPQFSRVEVRISTRMPAARNEPWLLAAPYQVMVTDNVRDRIFKVASALSDQDLFQPPFDDSELINLEFHGMARKHRAKAPDLCTAHASSSLSRHRQLFLNAKFGLPAEI